jgi:hypothetical protein
MKSKVSHASGHALPSPDRLRAGSVDDCERDGAAGEITNAVPAVTLKRSSTQKPGSPRRSSKPTASFPTVTLVSQFPEPPKFQGLYNSHFTRRTPAMASFTVRSAPAGDH